MNTAALYHWVMTGILALLLFFPISNLIWVLSVRRLQRKLQRQLNAAETTAQRRRARFIAAFVALAFSYLFYHSVIRNLYG